MEKQKKAPDGKGQEQQKPASKSEMKQEPQPEIPGKQESGQEFKLEGIHKAESKPVEQSKPETKPDEKNKSKKKDKPYEKWLYGMAGFGLGSLTTYLIMDHKHKKELELNGIEREAEEEARKLKARKKIVFVLE
jgi:hypothetical protein